MAKDEQRRNVFLSKLLEWDKSYFNGETSIVPDTIYDNYKREFKKEFPDDPYFKEVGAPINNKYEEIKLPFVVGGLDKMIIIPGELLNAICKWKEIKEYKWE